MADPKGQGGLRIALKRPFPPDTDLNSVIRELTLGIRMAKGTAHPTHSTRRKPRFAIVIDKTIDRITLPLIANFLPLLLQKISPLRCQCGIGKGNLHRLIGKLKR